ncbi:MAG: tRNA (adenosine(37)-N6)-dimethylallyltransferase MiaA [Patescibacteria group bacterium]|nr:tRNA (adenosine(37)-N6)-dimethylallyltransferase MiaA [Patescibacteria group bacterium]
MLGATASGKTEMSLELAKKIPNSYIISADSRQIYKGLDIGTGKLTGGRHKILKGQNILHFHNIPHYMIDIMEPNREYTVAQYQKSVKKVIRENKGRIPFLVGGTGLYINAIVDGLSIPPSAPDYKLRGKLEKETDGNLFQKLKKLDPICAQKIDSKNKRRLIRALEVCLKTGKPFSSLQKKKKPNYDVLQIGISVPREELYERIDKRVDRMIKQGLIEEAKKILKKYELLNSLPLPEKRRREGVGVYVSLDLSNLPPHSRQAGLVRKIWSGTEKDLKSRNLPPPLPPLGQGGIIHDSIGYKEIISYLDGEISLDEMIVLIKKNTRHYARRQMTWFKRDKRIQWIKNKKEAERLVKKFLR